MKKKVSLRQIKDYLKKKKSCTIPHGRSFAEDILQDPNHPISFISDQDFVLREIFNYIEIQHDSDKSRSTSEQ